MMCILSVLSSAMGSRTSDKCYPCLLMNNEYSTKTGMFLRDCFQPVLSLLQVYLRDAQGGDKGIRYVFFGLMLIFTFNQGSYRTLIAMKFHCCCFKFTFRCYFPIKICLCGG